MDNIASKPIQKVWTKEEEGILVQLYPTTDTKELQKVFNCSWPKIINKANRLSLRKVFKSKIWSQEEEQFLIKSFRDTDIKDLEKTFSINSQEIRNKASSLGLRKKDFDYKFWTKEEEELLVKLYPTTNSKELEKIFNVSYNRLRAKSYRLGLGKEKYGKVWSNEDERLFIQLYPISKTKELEKLFDCTSVELHIKAAKLKIKKQNRCHDLSVLLENTSLTYYWIGFLMADGYFSDTNRLVVKLHISDYNHLLKLGKYLNTKVTTTRNGQRHICNLAVADKCYVKEIKEKFELNNRKIYNPPSTKIFDVSDDLFIAWLIGFIDGDGHIATAQTSKNKSLFFYNIRLENNHSWQNIHQYILDRLQEITQYTLRSKVKISRKSGNRQNTSNVCFGKKEILQFLKTKAINLNLPFMNRKWNKISV